MLKNAEGRTYKYSNNASISIKIDVLAISYKEYIFLYKEYIYYTYIYGGAWKICAKEHGLNAVT